MSPRSFAHALLALLLAGCAAGVHRPDRPAESLLPSHSDALVMGETDREAVTRALGPPVLVHPFWRLALYREEAKQSATQFALTPWPVPFAQVTDRLERFTLVVFDVAGRVEFFDSGIIRRPPDWRRASPIEFDHPWLTLRAGDLLFSLASNTAHTDTLLAAPKSRDAWLDAARAGRRCTVLLTCGEGGCAERIAIDGGEEYSLPLRLLPYDAGSAAWPPTSAQAPWIETLVPFELSPGAHQIGFSSAVIDGRHTARVDCSPGAVMIVTEAATLTRRGKAFAAWDVDIAPALSTAQSGRPLVLFHEGRWLVGTRPDP